MTLKNRAKGRKRAEAHLLESDAVVRYHSEHARQQVLGLNRNMRRGVVHPLDDLLSKLLQEESQAD